MPAEIRRRDLQLALELADLADAVSMPFFAGSRESSLKTDGGVVTSADTEIESRMRDVLRDARPGDAIFGEEFGGERSADRVWLIDPIDGTGSLVEGGEDWSTLIALVEEGRPVVGVVSRPVRATRWWAATQLGAFRNGEAIRASATADLSQALMQEDFRLSVARGLASNPVASIAADCRAVRPWDLFFFMAVAEGKADFAVNWWGGSGPDLASQVCIVEAAGGRFSNLAGEVDIDAPVQLVSNGALHLVVLERLNELIAVHGFDPSAEPAEDIPAIREARATEPADSWTYPPSAGGREE